MCICQENCYHCCNYTRRTYDDIDFQRIQEIINQLNQQGIKKVVLTGGEAFLCKNLYLIIDLCLKYNFEISICSNGLLIDKNLKELSKRNIHKIIISLDTLDANLYQKLRGKRERS